MTTVIDRSVTRLVAVGGDRWRVLDAGGRVRGHVRCIDEEAGRRFCAQRFDPRSARFRELGRFWILEEAVECVRLSR